MDTWEWRMYWDTTWDTIWVSIDGTPLWNYLRAWYIYLYIYTPQTTYTLPETDMAPEIGWLEH